MTPKDILIPLGIFALQVCVIKWIDIKIKFAKSEAEARAAIKEVWVRFWSWASMAAPGVFALREFLKDGPVTRLAVIYLFFFTIGVAFRFTLYWAGRIISIMKDYGKISLDVHAALKGQNDIVKDFYAEFEAFREAKEKPNQALEPTATVVTPPAAQESRRP